MASSHFWHSESQTAAWYIFKCISQKGKEGVSIDWARRGHCRLKLGRNHFFTTRDVGCDGDRDSGKGAPRSPSVTFFTTGRVCVSRIFKCGGILDINNRQWSTSVAMGTTSIAPTFPLFSHPWLAFSIFPYLSFADPVSLPNCFSFDFYLCFLRSEVFLLCIMRFVILLL